METVVAKQKIAVTQGDLEELCEQNGNDIRQIINFLQYSWGSAVSTSGGTKDELLRVDSFSAAGKVFQRHVPLEMRMNLVFTDFGMIPLMVAEGYIGASMKSSGDDVAKLGRCVNAANNLGMWTIADQRIHKSQAWGLMPAAVTSVVAAAAATEGPAPFQLFPQWLGKMSKRGKQVRWMRSLRQRCGVGSAEAMLDTCGVLRARLFQKGQTATAIVNTLVDLRLTRDDMMEVLVDTAFDPTDVTLDSKLKASISREYKKRGIGDIVEKVVKDDDEDIEDDSDSDMDEDMII
jgi:hypothetical protein